MIERDYIMRMIQMLVQVVARILFLKHGEQYPEALNEIQKASKQILGIELEVLRRLSDNQMIDLLSLDASLGIPKCYAAGMLLKEEAEILAATKSPADSIDSFAKALSLLTESGIRHRGPFDFSHGEAIDFVAKKLQGRDVPIHTLKKLFCYYELVHHYAKAAGVLFEVIKKEPSFTAEGARFYESLAEKTDKELIDGNISRLEIDAGLRKMSGKEAQRST